jgi:Fe-S-cluster containining protein
VTWAEWELIAAAMEGLEAGTAEMVRRRIRESAGAERPVICPLLDGESGACLVYEARPVACRAYGFYAERGLVLGCGRIVEMGERLPEMVWGNHAALEREVVGLGEAVGLAEWCRG